MRRTGFGQLAFEFADSFQAGGRIDLVPRQLLTERPPSWLTAGTSASCADNAPLPEIDTLPILPDAVLIVENKESALLVPDHLRTVVIHSLGNHLNVLDEICWLDSARHSYWGDLDRAGFTLLSRARTRLPRLTSVMMDTDTIDQHKSLALRDTTRADPPEPNLTRAETAALATLSIGDGTYLRLEQERLAPSFVVDQLCRALAGDGEPPAGPKTRATRYTVDLPR